jgi:hypothetical protein
VPYTRYCIVYRRSTGGRPVHITLYPSHYNYTHHTILITLYQVELTEDDVFLVLATDGVWEFLDSEDVIQRVAQCLDSSSGEGGTEKGGTHDPQRVCDQLVQVPCIILVEVPCIVLVEVPCIVLVQVPCIVLVQVPCIVLVQVPCIILVHVLCIVV